MQPTGKLDSKLWVIASCPKKGDTSGPFSSQTGRFFLRHLSQMGVSITDIRIEYLMPEVPVLGGFEYFEKHKADEIVVQFKLLKDRIRECKPNMVFCLGAETLRYFHGQKDITKWRGHIMWNDNINCKTLYTYAPAHAHRQYFVDAKNKPGQYMALMLADIEKAVNASASPKFEQPDFKFLIRPSFVQAKQELERLLDTAKFISYDIEIIEPYNAHFIDCIGFCGELDSACCIPWYIPQDGGKPRRYFENEIEFLEIMKLCKYIMESNIPKIAQNSQFDTGILQQFYDIKTVNLTWDTMVAAHCLYSDLPKDLGTLISLYTELPYHKYLIGTGKLIDRWEYNAADALANLHIMFGEQEDMKDFGILHHYEKIVHPAINTCIALQLRGVLVDESLRQKVLKTMYTDMHQIERAFDLAFPVPLAKANPRGNFNPVSPKQKSAIFYGYFKCPVCYTKGKACVDKLAIMKFSEDARPYVRAIANGCLHYKESSVMVGRLKTKTEAGRIHCKYDVTGTDTGRLNSTISEIFNTGTNLQNLQKGIQRQMIIPDPGCEFCIVDLYAAEAFLVALLAGEMEMVKMLQSGKKIYTWLQEETQKRYPQECKKAEYGTDNPKGYKKAKQSVHAMNYAVKPQTMSLESNLPLYVCQWQHAFYHGKFPGIQQRMKGIEQQLNETRTIKSLLGRQRIFFQKKDYKLLNKAYAWPTQSTIGEIAIAASNKLHVLNSLHNTGDMSFPMCTPMLNTHDGLVIQAELNTREAVEKVTIDAFNIPLKVRTHTVVVPLELGWASNFNDIEDKHLHYYR